MTEPVDYKSTVFLPKTDFPMKAGLPQKEPGILARWQEMGLYAQLRNRRRGREKFILHDGPPYANGDMHIGHALNHILKDMVVRSQTLLGKDAPYVPGWDCHGLPIEWKVEEEYRKKKLNKDEVPVTEFRAECRAYAQKWVDVQREQLKRLGINADWDNPYLTMDFEAEATIVSELLKFAESGQLYRGAKPVMWSPVEKTALAEAEIEYEDIVSTQIDVAFEIVESPIPELVGAHAVIWTTTPWTIPVNQALAYGPDVEYVVGRPALTLFPDNEYDFENIGNPNLLNEMLGRAHELSAKFADRLFVVAAPLANEFAAKLLPGQLYLKSVFSETMRLKGSDLAGTIVRHPMHHFGGFFAKPRPMLPGDFVTTDSGTGLVHMSPDHGEDDFDLCKANGIDPVFAVEGDGKYRADWGWLGGEGSVINPKFNAPDGPICSDLREAGGLLAASADYKHSYPHSWRSKAKVIYRCTPQWFVPMDKALEPLPFRGGDGGGACPETQPLTDKPHPNPSPEGEGLTLRETATAAIAATRFIPEKGRNRLSSMVEGRPDWVLSRQRAWGVPITLFVDRKTGQYLCDPAVNARIIAAVKEQGVDAWGDERAQEYLGPDYAAADYERVVDILDVWFDSGCTHAFVLESGRWPDLQWPADLYLEGSDQHRGWFQSSLLQSCGTRGRAPYNAVLTHGFTMDQKGMKMSKSLGNTINPLDLMRDSGADILRLWALTVDFTEDHRIGKEILQGVSDQYRKLRNTFRYMLGALDGFSDAERVKGLSRGEAEWSAAQQAPDDADKGTVPRQGQSLDRLPELERYMLHLLADMDAKLRTAVDDFDFNTYVRLLTDFANEDLSAFFFDIRKDCLYCDAATDPKRMAYRTVLDILFHSLVRYAAPVLVFTSEEVWQTRFGADAESVHFADWPEVDAGWVDDALAGNWLIIRAARERVNRMIEPLRRDKELGSSLQADVRLTVTDKDILSLLTSQNLSEIFISADVLLNFGKAGGDTFMIGVSPTITRKCGRCWRHLPEVIDDGALCGRCKDVVDA